MKIILAYKSLKIPQNIGYFKILNGLALSAKKKKKEMYNILFFKHY